jgi:hypothetical protein
MDEVHEIEHFAEAAQAATALRLSRVIVTATTIADDAGVPLNDRQKISLLTTALLEFDGLLAELRDVLELDRLLARTGNNGGPPP